jgi:hypothetical protein
LDALLEALELADAGLELEIWGCGAVGGGEVAAAEVVVVLPIRLRDLRNATIGIYVCDDVLEVAQRGVRG